MGIFMVSHLSIVGTLHRTLLIACLLMVPAIASSDTTEGAVEKESTTAQRQFSRTPMPAWVQTTDIPSEKNSVEPNTYRLSETQFRWDDQGERAFRRYVVKANNTSGIKQIGQMATEFNPAYQTFELHVLRVLRNGKSIDKMQTAKIRFLERELGLEQSMYDGSVTVSILIDDVRVGDSLEYAFSIIGSNPVFNNKIFDYTWWQYESETQLRRVIITTPANRPMQYRFMGGVRDTNSVKPITSIRDGYRELVFEQRDVAAFHAEKSYPAGYLPATTLQFSEFGNWNEVARWASELFKATADDSSEFQSLVKQYQKISDPLQRAAEALKFVQSEIRYTAVLLGESSHRPTAPSEVLTRRYGDCKDKSLLLVSLYRALGFNAKPVLAGIRNHSGFNDWLPSPLPFDHVFVRLELKGNVYWIDPTAIQKPASILNLGKLHGGREVLVVDPKTDRITPIALATPAVIAAIDGYDVAKL